MQDLSFIHNVKNQLCKPKRILDVIIPIQLTIQTK